MNSLYTRYCVIGEEIHRIVWDYDPAHRYSACSKCSCLDACVKRTLETTSPVFCTRLVSRTRFELYNDAVDDVEPPK